MSATAVAQSSLVTSLKRYSRSWGLWLLLLVGPVGARFFVGRDDGSSVTIAVGNHLPVLTSAMLGVSLGIVVSTLLLPVAFLYLRANTTRRQPWQIEEVSPASRVAITLGRFGADVLVLFGVLAALNLGGWLLGWLVVTVEPVSLWQISFALWLVAAPAVMGLAAIRQLFDALPWTRRAFGDFLYLWVWLASIAVPAAAQHMTAGFAANMYDFAGFVRPLVYGAPAGSDDFAVGGVDALPGRVSLDVMAGLLSPGYIPSRLAWAAIAVALAAFAGLIYRPHRPAKRRWYATLADRLTAQPAPPPANPNAPPAHAARVPLFGLLRAEFTLIGGGRLLLLLALGATIGGPGTSGNKPLLIRAAGPALATLGVPGVLPDPKLELLSNGTVVAANDAGEARSGNELAAEIRACVDGFHVRPFARRDFVLCCLEAEFPVPASQPVG